MGKTIYKKPFGDFSYRSDEDILEEGGYYRCNDCHDCDSCTNLKRELDMSEYFFDKHSVEKWYYKSGQLACKIKHKNGKLHGVEKRFFENGQLRYKIKHKNGKPHGFEKHYFESGLLRYILQYKNGKKHGAEMEFNEIGNII